MPAQHCYGLGRLVLLLVGGVSVGAQSESCVVVPQHGGDGLDVHAVLEGQGGEGVTQVVEPKVFQTSILENPLMQRGYGIRVVHTSGAGGGEEPGIGWVLGVFSHQQLHRLLGDGDLADEVLCLGTGNHECARFILRGLLADGDGPLLHVQVFPPQGYQIAFSDATDQLRIEHGQSASPLRCVQVGFQILWPLCVHLLMPGFWHHAVVSRITDQQTPLYRPVQEIVR